MLLSSWLFEPMNIFHFINYILLLKFLRYRINRAVAGRFICFFFVIFPVFPNFLPFAKNLGGPQLFSFIFYLWQRLRRRKLRHFKKIIFRRHSLISLIWAISIFYCFYSARLNTGSLLRLLAAITLQTSILPSQVRACQSIFMECHIIQSLPSKMYGPSWSFFIYWLRTITKLDHDDRFLVIGCEFFSSNVTTVLLYGCEAWKTTKVITHRLQTFIYKCLQSVLIIKWSDKVSNHELWKRSGRERVEVQILLHKWGWIGHTLRKPEDNVTRQALTW